MIESPSGCAIDSSVPGGTRRFCLVTRRYRARLSHAATAVAGVGL